MCKLANILLCPSHYYFFFFFYLLTNIWGLITTFIGIEIYILVKIGTFIPPRALGNCLIGSGGGGLVINTPNYATRIRTFLPSQTS